MLESHFQEATAILKKLKRHGYEAYFVGGAVRDFLLGKTITDIDITTSARPEEVCSLFLKTIPIGIEHGTVLVRHHHRSYEVTTFRTESDYQDHRRPSEVSFVASLQEDLKRRDFTMNAMAMTEMGDIIDPFGGQQAIEKKIIRTVGSAEERFREDPLRMMRAVRFVSQLSFAIEEETKNVLKQYAAELRHISIERIQIEFEKLLLGPYTEKAFTVLMDSGLPAYFPGMADCSASLQSFSNLGMNRLGGLPERWAVIAIVLKIENLTDWLRKWKLSNQRINEVIRVHRCFQDVGDGNWTPSLVYKSGLETALSVERIRGLLYRDEVDLKSIRHIYSRLPIHRRDQLAVDGHDLLAWFQKKPGPWLSKLIQKIENAVIEGETVNERKAIRTWIEKQRS